MAASRRSTHNYVKLESKVHRLWREEATRFHQNMFEGFSSGPNKFGYHYVKKGCDLEEKITIAIYGTSSDNKNLKENEKKMIKNIAERIEKRSPEVCVKKDLTLVAIVYVHVLLNDENADNRKYILFRVPKFVKENKEGEKGEVNFNADRISIKYSSGEETVHDLNECAEAYFIDCDLRVYNGWEEYLQENWLPAGKMCVARGGLYRAGEDGRVLLDIMDTPARTDEGGALQLLDDSSSLLGKVGTGLVVASMLNPVGAVVGFAGCSLVTYSSLYSCGRSASKLLDRATHDQELNFLSDEDARRLWIDLALSGVATAAGFKVLNSGFEVLRSDNFIMTSSEMAAVVWRKNVSWIVVSNVSGVLQVVINRVIDKCILNDWSDLHSFRNVLCLFLNIFSPVEQIRNTLEEILTITKPFFNIASSVSHYLCWCFEELKHVVSASASHLMDIVKISGRFIFNVSVGLLDERFKELHDSFTGLLQGKISLVTFALNSVKHSAEVFSWFEKSFHQAKQDYRLLCDQKKARNILETVGMENEENMRKMFKELEDVIKVCGVDNADNKQMASLIELVDKFRSKLDADCNVNEFLFSVRVVCTCVKKCFKEKKNKYETEFDFERDFRGDKFVEDDFNKRFGLEAEGHVDIAMHFFAQSIALLQTEVELSNMMEMYKNLAPDNANKAIPSIQTEGILQYLFVNPPEVTDVSRNTMWQNLFRTQTGIAVDEQNVQMDRTNTEGKCIISIRPKSNNLEFKLAYFYIAQETPKLKGLLSVCTSVRGLQN